MSLEYDEDVNKNGFFVEMKKEFGDYFDRAIEENWIICVPRKDCLKIDIVGDDIFSHILVPNDELPETHFVNLMGDEVEISDKVITVQCADVSKQVKILFEETFYNKNLLKCKILCIDAPLNTFGDSLSASESLELSNLNECVQLLSSQHLNNEVLQKIDNEIIDFNHSTNRAIDLGNLVGVVRQLYDRCFKVITRHLTAQHKNVLRDRVYLDNIKLGVETYVLNGIYDILFDNIKIDTVHSDAALNKIINNLNSLNMLEILSISSHSNDAICQAKIHLSKIKNYRSVLEKLQQVKLAIKSIGATDSNQMAPDNIIPILVFLIIKSRLSDWSAHLVFLKHFRFLSSHSDQTSYIVTTLEAATEYLAKLDSRNLFDKQVDKPDSTAVLYETKKDLVSPLKSLFETIVGGDVMEVDNLLSNNNINSDNFCHPLCTCTNCNDLTSVPLVDKCDLHKGFSSVHIATLTDNAAIIAILLNKYNANVNLKDHYSNTPLHYAAARGFAECVIALMSGSQPANPKLKNFDGNTALHLACANGHLESVEILLQNGKTSVNAPNNYGDTALHLAVKYSYLDLIDELFKYGACITIKNNHKQTAIDFAHNSCIREYLLKRSSASSAPNFLEFDLIESNSNSTKPRSAILKQIHSLLRSVQFGDMNLTCFYLGIEPPYCSTAPKPTTSLCSGHPLCDCASCYFQSPDLPRKSTFTLSVNVSNGDGFTPLHIACQFGWLDILKVLVKQGAVLDVRTHSHQLTPLHLACQNRQIEIVRKLLQLLTIDEVNLQDSSGNTPLFYACMLNDVQMARVMIASGKVDVRVTNRNGFSAIKYAEKHDLLRIYYVLSGDV